MTTLFDTSIKLLSFIPLNLLALCMLHASLLHAVDPSKFGNRLTHWPASKLYFDKSNHRIFNNRYIHKAPTGFLFFISNVIMWNIVNEIGFRTRKLIILHFFLNYSQKLFICCLTEEAIFVKKKSECMCVYACVRFSTFQTPITYKRLEISIWNLVHLWSNHNP